MKGPHLQAPSISWLVAWGTHGGGLRGLPALLLELPIEAQTSCMEAVVRRGRSVKINTETRTAEFWRPTF